MIFWITVAALAAAVTYVVTRPLFAHVESEKVPAAADFAVYKDQLAEIDADVARGLVTETEADGARNEVSRRLLRSAEAAKALDGAAAGTGIAGTVHFAASVGIPLASVLLYLAFGQPGLPGRPLTERLAAAPENAATGDLVAKVEARLREHPEDGRGWDVIAPVYSAQGRFADAAQAYAKAAQILGETPKRLEGFAISDIRAADGVVTAAARKALARSLELEPARSEPRIWLALAKEQEGKIDEAIADYRAIIAAGPQDASWRKSIEARLAALEKNGTKGTGESLSGMDSEMRAKVEEMVSGLAEKLKANGNDLEGWLKLMRSYKVMGRDKEAADAASAARKALAGNAAALGEIDAAAKSLGIGS